MGFSLRDLGAKSKFSQEITLDAIGKIVPLQAIDDVIKEEGVKEKRQRKLSMRVIMMLCIAMNLYTDGSLGYVMRELARGLRYIFPNPRFAVPKDAAISNRRYQLGARPMRSLFRRVCVPLATPDTPGAFLFGLRLMAVDSTIEEVPDTPENAAAFGRHRTDRGESAYPQVLGVYLVECGTRAIVDVHFYRCLTSERTGGYEILSSVGPGMLLTFDRGFYSYEMIRKTLAHGAHVLGRMPAGVKPTCRRRLPDGSILADIFPSDSRSRPIRVRIIAYTVTDPDVPGYGEKHRLVTTLLDYEQAPAMELVAAYHERWEIELVFDELDTHQRLAGRPLRSLKPVGVIQELYGLVIAHYAVHALMHEAALQAGIDPDRLSFVHTLRLLKDAVPEFQMTAPEQLPELYERLLNDIASVRLPQRRARYNPRVVKTKMSKYRRKRPETWPACHKPPAFNDEVSVI